MEWKTLCGKSGYIDTPGALLPFYQLNEEEIILFDSGVKPDEGLLDAIASRRLRVRAVLSSHLHIDHVANNPALIARWGTEIFADRRELHYLPMWDHDYPVTFVEEGRPLVVDGVEFGVVPTPGHSPGHLAYITPDGVCYVGDALMAGPLLRQSKMPYMEDVDRSIVSMEALRLTRCSFYIVAHKGVFTREEMPALVDENIRKELDLYDVLRQQLTVPKAYEQALTDFMVSCSIRQEMMKVSYVYQPAKARLDALIHAGEYRLEDGIVHPR